MSFIIPTTLSIGNNFTFLKKKNAHPYSRETVTAFLLLYHERVFSTYRMWIQCDYQSRCGNESHPAQDEGLSCEDTRHVFIHK